MSLRFCVIFLAWLIFISASGVSRADDCGVRGYDGGADIIKFDCEPVGTTPASPLKVRTSTGEIRGISLVEIESSPGVPNPAASKFRVRYKDSSNKAVIKALGFISPGISACAELQMIGYHPSYPLNGNYKLVTHIDCSATNPYVGDPTLKIQNPAYANSLWALGYYEYYQHNGLDGIAGNSDDDIPALNLAELGAQGFKPIGNGTTEFSGSFNGNNKTITGLYINRPTTDYVGLFGSIAVGHGLMSNIVLVNVDIKGQNNVGGLAGHLGSNNTVSNGSVTGTVSGVQAVGGLVGAIGENQTTAGTSTTLSDSHSTATVSGAKLIGGLVGYSITAWASNPQSYIYISNSYATGSVTGTDYHIGGLVGCMGGTIIISDSHATGDVLSGDWSGGLIGGAYPGANITRSYATGTVGTLNVSKTVGGLVGMLTTGSISRSYATGNVRGAQTVAGLVATTIPIAYVSDSYATGNVSGSSGAGGLVSNHSNGCSIANSYATGAVSGTSYLGGLVSSNSSSITNSYATGAVSGTSYCLGGLLGYLNPPQGVVSASYFTDTANQNGLGTYEPGGAAAFQGVVHAHLVYATWDFTNIWEARSGKYPKLKDVGGPQ